jgi:hypothetical protein
MQAVEVEGDLNDLVKVAIGTGVAALGALPASIMSSKDMPMSEPMSNPLYEEASFVEE